jgi:DNA polymerase-3 subunit delta'
MNSEIDKIIGQERVKKTLNNFIQSQIIPQAFLFTGISGVGKDNTAIQFAKAVLTHISPDQADKSIRLIEQLQEPAIKLIIPLPRGKNETDSSTPTEKLTQDEMEIVRKEIELKAANPYHKISIPKANSIKINSIRDIKRFLSMDYNEVGFRFILITDAHLMNEEAQNSLLKSLEEPPEKVIFILTTSLVSKLRPTILSRCWRIHFDPLREKDLASILNLSFHIDKTTADDIAPFAMGSVQSALDLNDLNIRNLKEKTISILRYSFGRKFNSAFDELNSILLDQNSSNYPVVIKMIIHWLNDIQKYKLSFDNFFFKDHLETLEKFCYKFPDVDFTSITSRLDRLSNLPGSNINQSILSANLIFELASIVISK